MKNTHCMTWIMERKLKNVENETQTLYDMEYGEKTENHEKWETQTLGHEIWWETLKNLKNGTHTWIIARKLKTVENEMQSMTWNMARKT